MDRKVFVHCKNQMEKKTYLPTKHCFPFTVQSCRKAKNRTYRCHSYFIGEEVGQTGSLADESLLTEREAVGIFRLLTRLNLCHQLSLQ